jgi:hypothetical protein
MLPAEPLHGVNSPPRTCRNHPGVETAGFCGDCGLPFCPDCLVEFYGRPLCARCKWLLVRDIQRRFDVRDRLAHNAFVRSLVGLLLCGPIFEPLALAAGIQALRRHRGDAAFQDRWKAVTAVVISSIYCLLMLFWIIAMFVIRTD